MVDLSSLFGKGKTTHTYKLGSKTIDLTPTGLTPAELVKRLFDSGVQMVIFSDTDHSSPGIRNNIAAIIGDKSVKMTKFGYELADKTEQYAYDNYARNNDREIKEIILSPRDLHAPNAEKHPQLNKEYFASKWKIFETAKDNKVKVVFYDEVDETTFNTAVRAKNQIAFFTRNRDMIPYLRDKDGKPIDLEKLLAKDFSTLKQKLYDDLSSSYSRRLLPEPQFITAQALTTSAMIFFKDIGLDYNAAHTLKQINEAADKKLSSLKKARDDAEEKRDVIRDGRMAENATAMIQSSNDRVAIMVGNGHLGASNQYGRPTLEQLLRSKLGQKVVRIELMGTSAANANKLGVTIGGVDTADYTIFFPKDTSELLLPEPSKSVPAKNGPHKDKLEPLKLSHNDLSLPQFAMSDVPDTQEFSSGLSTALPKAPPTKTV